MKRIVSFVVLAVVLGFVAFSFQGTVAAQSPAPMPVPPTGATPAGLPPAETPAEIRRQSDAAVDRNILSPTAETLNEGQLTFNSYELFLAGVSYGVTNDFQISGTTLLPITEDFPLVLAIAGKLRVHKTESSIFSIQPLVLVLSNNGSTASLMGLYALYDRILDEEGKVAVTLGGSALGVVGSSDADINLSDGLLLSLTAGISARTGRIVKLMGELTLPAAYHDGTTEFAEEGMLFNYGVRFFGPTLAVDLTFVRPIHPDVDTGLILGFPFVAFSARF
jgi:hypothetical protein